jgi:hypothetical protein
MNKFLKVFLLSTTALIATPDMSEAAPAALAIAGAAASTFITGSTIFGLNLLGSFLVRAALGLAMNALAPKPKTPELNRSSQQRGYLVTQTGSALDHQIVYGKARIAGVRIFDEATGTNNKFLHRVLAFAGHEIEAFDEIYINDEVVTLDGSGNVTSPSRYDGFVRINQHLGTSDQAADSDLVAEVEDWTSEHRLRGVAYLYIRLKFDSDVFANGVPEITATVKGKKLYDPRTETTAWSSNPALILRDYITSGYGLAEETANIDDTLVSAAANVCDETDTLDSSTRYTCNGAFLSSQQPYDTINDLLTSMGGLLWYAQGKWRMKPAYWTTPAITITEDDLRGSLSIQTRHSRRDNFNTIRGTFRGAESNWQPTDYPEVSNEAFLEADNNQESVLDYPLNFTDTSGEARRIARIALERNRQQLTIQGSFGLKAFQVQVGDVVNVTNSRMGWTDKPFEVSTWTFGVTDDMDLQVQMTLRETAESVFDEIDDGVVYERDNTTLLSPFEVPDVGIAAVATSKVINEKITNIVALTITSGASERVDRVEVQFKKSSDTDWIAAGTGALGLFEVLDLEQDDYDFRARAINTFGVKGVFTTLSNFAAVGLIDPPDTISGFSAEVNNGTIHLEWEPVSNLDLSYYRIRHAVETSGATWANATTAVDKVPRPANTVSLPSRAGTYFIRAYDKLGIPSTSDATVVVPFDWLETFTNTDTQTEDPTFSGTKTDCSVASSELFITDPSTAPSEATYDFSNYIDTGSVRRVRAKVLVEVRRKDNSAGLFDDLPDLFDELAGLFDDLTGFNTIADTNVLTYISTTEDDPAGTPTWSDYRLFRAGDFYGRAFRFRAVLKSTTDDVTPAITGLEAVVEYN